jgi:hypothetical protein
MLNISPVFGLIINAAAFPTSYGSNRLASAESDA